MPVIGYYPPLHANSQSGYLMPCCVSTPAPIISTIANRKSSITVREWSFCKKLLNQIRRIRYAPLRRLPARRSRLPRHPQSLHLRPQEHQDHARPVLALHRMRARLPADPRQRPPPPREDSLPLRRQSILYEPIPKALENASKTARLLK